MRRQILLLVLVLWVAACGSDHVTLRGSIVEDAEGEGVRMWVVGGPTATSLADGAFEMTGIKPGPMDLIFADERGEIARTEIRNVPAGATLTLERIRWSDGRALPTDVRVEGAKWVMINGIRMADPSAFPRRVDGMGVMIAAGQNADVLLVRPHEESLPDLRVVITPSTQVVTPNGEPASVRRLSFSDPVHVEGRVEEGYVIATRLVLPVEAAAGRGASVENGSAPAATAAGRRTDAVGERGAIRHAVDAVMRRASGGEAQEASRKRKGGREDIPPGHRPPPGECRDWVPGLPPGQQPPPRKC